MGAGKSAVGRQLARLLHLDFADSDEDIEARTGVDIAFIFEKEGEEGFRSWRKEDGSPARPEINPGGETRPPTEEEMKTLKTKAGELKDKNKSGTPADSGAKEPEPEPEPQSTSLVPTRP